MHSKVLSDEIGERTIALVFDKGDEVVATLRKYAEEHNLGGSRFTGIGAFSSVTLGWFDRERKNYKEIEIPEQVEVLTLAGDITLAGDKPQVHAHVVVGKSDATAHGGHLIRGIVMPTLELTLVESPRYLERRYDPETGLLLVV